MLSAAAAILRLAAAGAAQAEPSGLLFRLSADKSLTADYAAGDPVPNFSYGAHIVPTGVSGGAFSDDDDVVLAWKAPGNIYAQRGTLSFFWRSRTPVGVAPFVLFRVGFADHTSWDMVFLRIDWNGHGFDAFVTDNNLARTRVSFTLPQNPAPDAWTHLAFTWDENTGVQLFVNGKLAAKTEKKDVYDSGLDQFGTAARVVAPHQVQSRYSFMRGSDYDELRIYDHALAPSEIAELARNQAAASPAAAARDLSDPATREEWWLRYGWNRKGDVPPELTSPVTRIRKVEFADAKDLKEWMYKGVDGIPETTWPGVYNRSRLPGRNDYFTLPDWNVYVEGGKAYTLTLPDEPFNHVEIQGAAYGALTYTGADGKTVKLAERPKDQERTFDQFGTERTGGALTFTNIAQETPIQEIAAFDLGPGKEPQGSEKLSYTIRTDVAPDSPDLKDLNAFIAGRFPADERSTVVAVPNGAPVRKRPPPTGKAMPIVHVLIPYEFGASPPAEPLYRSYNYGWDNMYDALDGIAIDIPALHVKPTHDGLFPLNIQVKDPIWPGRNLMDVSVSVKPSEARTIWLDTRDRILPNKSLYLTIAGAGQDFDARQLDGAKIRLVFKPRAEGLKEDITDRLNELKDNWGFLVEEHTASKRESLYRRLLADADDLFRVDPDNKIGREYWADIMYNTQGPMPFSQPATPAGEPEWAFRQLEDLKLVTRFVNWWIDNRQVAYGDLGGGLSDDTDLLEQWPGLALMGVEPEKITASHSAMEEAIYRNGMFTNGLATITTDELHSYEDGINSNSEAMYLKYGDPKVVERLMTTDAAYPRIIQVNKAGHLHFVTNWYGGTKIYREGPWEWSKYYSYLVLHPGVLLGDFNADPQSRKFVIGLADGLLAHGHKNPDGTWTYADEINWRTDATRGILPPNTPPYQLFWAAWKWTGDTKYLEPLISAQVQRGDGALRQVTENVLAVLDKNSTWGQQAVKAANGPKASNLDRYLAWETTGDTKYLDDLYGDEIRSANERMYSQTEGHWWSDRVEIPSEFLQRTRLGGIALMRNWISPGATVSWRFADETDADKMAILVQDATPAHFKVIAYNTTDHPVQATMTGWDVTAGQWKSTATPGTFKFEKSLGVPVTFAPKQTVEFDYALVQPGQPVETRADLGIDAGDVHVQGHTLSVTVHSLGHIDAPAGEVQVQDAAGKVVAQAATPPLKAPLDLTPKTATVKLTLPAGFQAKGAWVRVSLPQPEITQMNNAVRLP